MLIEKSLKWDVLGWSVGTTHSFEKEKYCGVPVWLMVKKEEIDMMGIYFHIELPQGWSNVDFTLVFSVQNEKGNQCCKMDLQHNFAKTEGRGFVKYRKITELAKYVYNGNIHFCVNIKNIRWEHNHIEQINAIYQTLNPDETSIVKKSIQSTINQIEKKNNDYLLQIEKLNNKVKELEVSSNQRLCSEISQTPIKINTELSVHQMIEYIEKNINKLGIEDVEKLQREINKLFILLSEKIKDVSSCSICLEKTIDTVLVPCGHRTVCNTCSEKVKNCPICKAEISQRIKTY